MVAIVDYGVGNLFSLVSSFPQEEHTNFSFIMHPPQAKDDFVKL
mgnify:CR=1 FL=1